MQFDSSKQSTLSHDQRTNNAFLLQKKNNSKITKAIKHMDSHDPSVVIKGLNTLTQKTYELTDSAAIQLDIFPELILSLGSLLDTVNPIVNLLPSNVPYDSYESFILDRSNKFWNPTLMSCGNHEFKLAARALDDNIMALTVLNIIRNLSFESFNESVISSSAVVMKHLVALVYAAVENGSFLECAQMAFDVLVNIGGRIDITGRKRLLANTAFLEDVRSDERNKSLHFMRCSEHMSALSTLQYVNTALALFPLVHHVITRQGNKRDDRFYILRGLELLAKLASVPENSATVARSPDSLLLALVDLLAASHSLLDPVAQSTDNSASVTGDSAGRLRPPGVLFTTYSSLGVGQSSAQQQATAASLGCTGFFSADQCDLELRDLAVECLLTMCQTGIAMQLRVAETPDAITLLCRIAGVSATVSSITTYGQAATSAHHSFSGATSGVNRTEGNAKSVQILALLFVLPEVRGRYLALRPDLVVMASSDEAMADVVCNKASAAYSYVTTAPPAFALEQAASAVDGFSASSAMSIL